jgi:small GTP-binding protein
MYSRNIQKVHNLRRAAIKSKSASRTIINSAGALSYTTSLLQQQQQQQHNSIHSCLRRPSRVASALLLQYQNFHSTTHYKIPKSDSSENQDEKTLKNVRFPRPVSITKDMHLLNEIPLADVRNFCFIAHVDHGKSSLASRVLELTGNLGSEQQWTGIEHANLTSLYSSGGTDNIDNYNNKSNDDDNNRNSNVGGHDNNSTKNMNDSNNEITNSTSASSRKEQIELLDTLAVEKERGITVKASAASMLYPHPSAKGPHGVLLLNMVDTPGHVDFGTEVVRTLSSVQGAVLLFDAAQGVQAQSLSVHEKAKNMSNIGNIIPALTKVDLPSARTLDVTLSISDLFDFDPDEVLLTSARSRKGVAEILEAVCCNIPAPEQLPDDDGKILRAKVVDSWFEPLRGVVCLVQIVSGELSESSRVTIIEPAKDDQSSGRNGGGNTRNVTSKDHYSVQDVGLVLPHRIRTGKLSRGQMGYVIVGLRDPRQARPGTVMVLHKDLSKAMDMTLPAAQTVTSSQSVLFASVHPMAGEGFDELSSAVDRLALNDTGLEIHRTSGASSSEGGPFLGPGLRVGFQGLLHVEVFQQRLLDEFGLEAIVT